MIAGSQAAIGCTCGNPSARGVMHRSEGQCQATYAGLDSIKETALHAAAAFRRTGRPEIADEFGISGPITPYAAFDYMLLESVEADGIEWGISFDGPNPKPDGYVACKDKENALRLFDKLSGLMGLPNA